MCNLSEEIYRQALSCGFDKCGIVPVSALEGVDKLYEKRIHDVPISQYFYKSVGNLKETRARFPWARSIVILVFDYGKFRFPKELQGKYGKAFFLEPEKQSKERFDIERLEKWFVENGIRAEGGEQFGASSIGPLRYIAMKAGLGIVRKNNFFYTEAGSYNSLFGYVIDKECERIQDCDMKPCAEKCDLCRRACKTGALEAPYTMNPFRCVSFLTTFGNSEVPEGLTDEMYEEWVCGCDDCQDACPHNMRHDWSKGKTLVELEDIKSLILPENYEKLTDEFLIHKVIPKTANHLQDKDLTALRKNAARAVNNHKNLS
jgi:epoxyqueuosine reductase QueG